MSDTCDMKAFILIGIGAGNVEPNTEGKLEGHLDELNAANIHSGPFRVICTDDLSLHLTFTEVGNRPTIRILSPKAAQQFYICDRSGIAK